MKRDKRMKLKEVLLIACCALFSMPSWASEEKSGDAAVGEGFAVLEANHETGFKLSEKAIQTVAVRYVKAERAGSIVLPRSAIVYFRDESGVYRRRAGRIQRIKPEFRPVSDMQVEARSSEIVPGDEIAVEEVAWLRATEISLFEENEEVHGH